MRYSLWFPVLLGLAIPGDPRPVAAQEGLASLDAPRFTRSACPFTVSPPAQDEVTCGTVEVPEDWDNPSSRKIGISVAVFGAREKSTQHEALLRLGGGPTPSLPGAAAAVTSQLRDKRDLVVFDYRGTGSVGTVCPDIGKAYVQTFTEPLTAQSLSASQRRIAEQCRGWAQEHGVELAAYNARSMALDVVAIVDALGYKTWSIDAVSFGTAVAQHVMRIRPPGLRAAILRGPLALDADRVEEEGFVRALRLMAQYCARQPACASEFPDPLGDYDALYDKLDRSPMRVAVQKTEAFPDGEFFLTGTALKRIVIEMLYSRSGLAAVPMLIREAGRGNTAPVALMANRLAMSASRLSGANWAAQCDVSGAWANAPRPEQAGSRADYFRAALGGRCAHLGVDPAPSGSRQPVQSDIPTLIVVGEHDPVTPPAYAQAIARGLDRAYILEMPGLGHEFPGACTIPLILSFVDNPGPGIDGTCFEQSGDVPFAGLSRN